MEEVVVRSNIAEQQSKCMENIKIEEGGDKDQILDENDKINTNLISQNHIQSQTFLMINITLKNIRK